MYLAIISISGNIQRPCYITGFIMVLLCHTCYDHQELLVWHLQWTTLPCQVIKTSHHTVRILFGIIVQSQAIVA